MIHTQPITLTHFLPADFFHIFDPTTLPHLVEEVALPAIAEANPPLLTNDELYAINNPAIPQTLNNEQLQALNNPNTIHVLNIEPAVDVDDGEGHNFLTEWLVGDT